MLTDLLWLKHCDNDQVALQIASSARRPSSGRRDSIQGVILSGPATLIAERRLHLLLTKGSTELAIGWAVTEGTVTSTDLRVGGFGLMTRMIEA
jgi:hypothetical protein